MKCKAISIFCLMLLCSSISLFAADVEEPTRDLTYDEYLCQIVYPVKSTHTTILPLKDPDELVYILAGSSPEFPLCQINSLEEYTITFNTDGFISNDVSFSEIDKPLSMSLMSNNKDLLLTGKFEGNDGWEISAHRDRDYRLTSINGCYIYAVPDENGILDKSYLPDQTEWNWHGNKPVSRSDVYYFLDGYSINTSNYNYGPTSDPDRYDEVLKVMTISHYSGQDYCPTKVSIVQFYDYEFDEKGNWTSRKAYAKTITSSDPAIPDLKPSLSDNKKPVISQWLETRKLTY